MSVIEPDTSLRWPIVFQYLRYLVIHSIAFVGAPPELDGVIWLGFMIGSPDCLGSMWLGRMETVIT